MFKTSFKAALLASAFAGLAATAALADEAVVTPAPMAPVEEPASPWTIGGSVGYTTNYMFRGQTQTHDDGAVFGSFDVGHESGLYAGIWGSSIKEFTPGDDANIELDFYAGFANSINAFSYDVGGVYYMYPGANDAGAEYNYYEIYAKTGYDFGYFSVGDGIYYSPEYTGETGDTIYGYGDLTIPIPGLPFDIAAVGSIGYLEFLSESKGLDDYWDWSAGATASVLGFDLSAKYIGTMGNSAPVTELNDDAFSFTVSRSF